MSDDTPDAPLPTNAEDLKRHKALSAMETTSTVADSDTGSSSTDASALGEALGSIKSAALPPSTPSGTRSVSAAVKVKPEDVALVVSTIFCKGDAVLG